MPAPQPRPRRLPWSPPPSAPALVSRPSAAPWAAPRPGPRAARRVRSRRTAARARKRAGTTGSISRARATAARRSAPAAPSSAAAAKCSGAAAAVHRRCGGARNFSRGALFGRERPRVFLHLGRLALRSPHRRGDREPPVQHDQTEAAQARERHPEVVVREPAAVAKPRHVRGVLGVGRGAGGRGGRRVETAVSVSHAQSIRVRARLASRSSLISRGR